MINIDTKVTKTRKGWQVLTYNHISATWQAIATFTSRLEAYAYAYQLEHGL